MFDRFVGIDWSGARSPMRSFAVSLAECGLDERCPNPILKKLSRQDVFEWISKQIMHSTKTLIGIDCNLGYVGHIAKRQLGLGCDYRQLWEHVDKLSQASPNFFAGNALREPSFGQYFWQSGEQPEWFDRNLLQRETETAAVKQGIGNPESPFKLIGAKQVGKGGLAGMRMMHHLKNKWGSSIAIWPFESNLVSTATVVISENFPRLFIRKAGYGNEKVRDIETLNKVLLHFNTARFESDVPLNDHLTDAIIASAGMRWVYKNENPLSMVGLPQIASDIEGWIFGVYP